MSEAAFEHLRTSFMAAFDENGDNKIDITEVIRFSRLSVIDVGLSVVTCRLTNEFNGDETLFADCMDTAAGATQSHRYLINGFGAAARVRLKY